MFKNIAITAITISTLLSPSMAIASDESENRSTEVQEKRAEIRSNIEEKREEIKNKVEAKKEEIKLKFVEKRTETANKVIERQAKHADNLDNIIQRVQARIEILKTEGKDTAAAQTELDKAKSTLAEVLISITTSTDILNSITTDNIDTEFPKLKDSIRLTHQKLVATQKAIRNSINEMKKVSDPTTKDDSERSKKE